MVLRGLAGKRGPAVRDYKAVLVSLIAEYERRANMQLDTSKVTAAEVVTHLLDERGMSIDRLAKSLGIPQNSLNDMLHDRMEWSKSAIMAISSHFGLQPMLFLR
jgi:predicted XRE-type DNA-binding protein